MTPTEIAEYLNHGRIDAAAKYAADHLYSSEFAVVELEPDDGTRYLITVIADRAQYHTRGEDYAVRGHYLVATSFGTIYPWHGNVVHADYVTEKWVADGRLWTGVVITEFLNALCRRMYPSALSSVRDVAVTASRNPFHDAMTPHELLGMLAGAASVCWTPGPTGIFDSRTASTLVDAAADRLTEIHLAEADPQGQS